jgi:Flp pilus assembly protein TadG
MTLSRICRDERGTSAIEFSVTAPAFFLILFAIIEAGLLLWTQLGLQHGAERAARCYSVNKTLCNNVSATQTYAAQQSFGLNPQPSAFTVSTAACGKSVTASYTYQFLTANFGLPALELKAQACFPE